MNFKEVDVKCLKHVITKEFAHWKAGNLLGSLVKYLRNTLHPVRTIKDMEKN